MHCNEEAESSSDAEITTLYHESADKKTTKYTFTRSKKLCLQQQKNHLKPITEVLQEVVKGTTNFFSEETLCKTNFTIKVEGVGWLTFPLTDNRIEKLGSISANHEIPGSKLQVNIKESQFSQLLETIRVEIGFSDSCKLEAELHNMLIYSPGHSLDFHQDSETTPNMVGTLVIVVPSPHIGGNLIIQHDTKEHTFVSENLMSRSFKCIGFYADCKLKMEKVREGVRVALMYKLILKSSDNTPTPTSYVNRNLKNAIQRYFDQCRIQNSKFQNKFVYLLDHIYTERSLKWNMLKGEDNKTVNALLAVAKSLNLVPYLAIAEIEYGYHNQGKYHHKCANPIPIQLDTVDYHLLNFINSNNEKQPFDNWRRGHWVAREKEICWTKETTTSFQHYETCCGGFPDDSIYVDYWYKRGAVVLWPSSMKDEVNFKLNYKEALKELQAKIAIPWNKKEVCEIVKKCSMYLRIEENFQTMAKIALYINDKDVSMSILSHFKWEVLIFGYDCFENATILAELDLQYGSIWCIDLLNKWKSEKTSYEVSNLIHVFVSSKGSKEVVHLILNKQISSILSLTINQNSPDEIEQCIKIVCDYFISCTVIKSSEYVDKVMSYIISNPLIFTNRNLCVLYLKLKKNLYLVSNDDIICYSKPLKTYIETSFAIEIANFANTKYGDWSIEKQLKCQCKHCKEVNAFLLSKTETKLKLKLPQSYREHVDYNFKSLDLPVSLTVISGMGIEKMVFLKNESLHSDRLLKCKQLKSYLKEIE